MGHGIAPDTLLHEVRSTSPWALEPGYTQASYQAALRSLGEAGPDWDAPEHRAAHFRGLIAAHFTTCAGFCPTNVDNRIRFHAWQEAKDAAELDALIQVANEAVEWPVTEVSDRWVKSEVPTS